MTRAEAAVPRLTIRSAIEAGPRTGNGQLALPSLGHLVLREPIFAHPFERHFARLLDTYRIRWAYEPTTFLLSRRADGSLEECFTPDFYLPDLRTYVELTSMRQPLVTRKHRKLRRFRSAFPGTRVVMLYRRDYHRLLSTWSRESAPGDEPGSDTACFPDAGRLLYARPVLDAQLDQVAHALGERSIASGKSPLLVGLGHGGGQVAHDLAGRLRRAGIVSSVDALLPDDRARLVRGGGTILAGRTATLVTTVVSTGLAATFAAAWLRRRGAIGVDVCALLDRASARVVPVPLRYESLPAPIEHLVGYGLDHRREFRDRPDIAVLDAGYDGPLLGVTASSPAGMS